MCVYIYIHICGDYFAVYNGRVIDGYKRNERFTINSVGVIRFLTFYEFNVPLNLLDKPASFRRFRFDRFVRRGRTVCSKRRDCSTNKADTRFKFRSAVIVSVAIWNLCAVLNNIRRVPAEKTVDEEIADRLIITVSCTRGLLL